MYFINILYLYEVSSLVYVCKYEKSSHISEHIREGQSRAKMWAACVGGRSISIARYRCEGETE